VDREGYVDGSLKALGVFKKSRSAADVLERTPVEVFTMPVPGDQSGGCPFFIGTEALLLTHSIKEWNLTV
jgi:hypothetical protein